MNALSKIAVIIGDEDALHLKLARFLATFGIDSVLVPDAGHVAGCLGPVEPNLVVVTSGTDRCEHALAHLPEAVSRYGKAGTTVMVCADGGDVGVLSIAVAAGADECLIMPFDAELLKFKLEQTGVLAFQ